MPEAAYASSVQKAPPSSALPPPPGRWLSRRRRKKLLVLDVNGLLCWRARKGADLSRMPRSPDATAGNFHIFVRPYVPEFLAWCAERFHIVVWSTATSKNLEPMVQLAFRGKAPPVAVFDQSDCTDTGEVHPGDATGKHPVWLKELERLWADERVLSKVGRYGPADTLLLDDSPYKAVGNPEHTALHPAEWLGPVEGPQLLTFFFTPQNTLKISRTVANCLGKHV